MNIKSLTADTTVSLRSVPVGDLARALHKLESGSWWNTLDDEPEHVQLIYIREARRFLEILKDYASHP